MRSTWRGSGWYGESYRHYLSAQGIRTTAYYKRRPGVAGSIGKTKIVVEKVMPGRAYPVTVEDVKRIVARMPQDDRKGLKSIEFVEPKTEPQKQAWAQLVRSRRAMLIFSQPKKELETSPDDVRDHVKQYVIPHELGHHVALNRRGITDKSLATAEARADAYAAGMDVEDRDVIYFKKYHDKDEP